MENLLKINGRLYLYHLGHSKTDQLVAEQHSHAEKPVADKAADTPTAWHEASNIITGPIFRRIRGGTTVAEPLSAEAGGQNIPLGDTMALTRHRSIQTMMRYLQTGAIGQTRAARLQGDDPPPSGRTPDSVGL
jgi:hypothetical protein